MKSVYYVRILSSLKNVRLVRIKTGI